MQATENKTEVSICWNETLGVYGKGLGGEKEGTQKHAGIWMRERWKCSVSFFIQQ